MIEKKGRLKQHAIMIKIETDQAPKAIGPYSQGVIVGNHIYVSGQLPVDPSTNAMVEGDTRALTNRILLNIQAILKAGGSDLNQVVKTTVYMKDLQEFAAMNEEYGKHFTGDVMPARETVEVKNLPKGSPIEISCVAVNETI